MSYKQIKIELYYSELDPYIQSDVKTLILLLEDLANLILQKEDKILKLLNKNKVNAQLELTILDSEGIREINSQTRNINKVTDVLSFPNFEFSKLNKLFDFSFKPYDYLNPNAEQAVISLGEILICPEKAKEQANNLGHSFMREFCFLYMHGILHLMGYDHLDKDQAKIMYSLQNKIIPELEVLIIKHDFEV
ncbi:MAG TPA: rRNA maturation RNase YbeY [Candidatus Eisenbacteria bacterium]|nr:rRNA maturation RNase YbeY [Candidatus Eisenbacteria bacterium]